MKLSRLKFLKALRRKSRFEGDESGIAAVEFAMIAPLMMMMYLGVLELSQGYVASRKVAVFARTVADLTAQSDGTLSSTDAQNIRNSANWIMSPYPVAGQLKMTVSSVIFKPLLFGFFVTAVTDWSVSYEGVFRACGTLSLVSATTPPSLTRIPLGLASVGTTLIVADVSYDYVPLLGGTFQSFGGGSTTKLTLTQTAYMKPRNVARVDLDSTLKGNGATTTYCNQSFP